MMRRSITLATVTLVLAAAMTIVPVPTVVWAKGLETVTTPVELRRESSVAARGDVVPPPSDAEHHRSGGAVGPAQLPDDALGARDDSVDGFTAIGVTLDVAPDGPVAFRVREQTGWSPWMELSFADDHAPEGAEAADDRPGVTSDPFVVDRSTGYQIQVPLNVSDAQVHLVTETEERVSVEVDEAEAGASTPAIHTRAGWGARPYDGNPSEASRLTMAVVHHSAGTSSGSTASILRSIQAYHMDGNGWSDIGYNFAVDRAGEIWEARAGGIDRAIVGAHAYGFNTGSVGVVVLGDYQSESPTAASLEAVENIISWKFARHHVAHWGTGIYWPGVDTDYYAEGEEARLSRVVGHRDVGSTTCPGGTIYGKLDRIRNGLGGRTGSDRGVVPSLVLPGRWDAGDAEDVFLYRPGSSHPDPYLDGQAGPTMARRGENVNGLYEPLVGDFDGNGVSDVFWYGDGDRPDSLWYGTTNGGHLSREIPVRGSYEPFVADLDGDGRDDIIWHRPYGRPDHVWYGNGNRSFSKYQRWLPGGHPEPLVGDFDGDGHDDIFFYGGGDSADTAWFGGGRGRFHRVDSVTVGGYYRPFVGDFTGDGRDDIFWYRPGSQPDHIWPGGSWRGFSSRKASVNGLYDPFVGDFDGNGVDDVFWSKSDGADHQWMFEQWAHYTSHSDRISSSFRSDAMTLSGSYLTVLDADGNGRDELFALETPTTGRLWFWGTDGQLRSTAAG